MAVINFASREITAKLVYFGASEDGCTSQVQHLHGHLTAHDKTPLNHFGVEGYPHSWTFSYVLEASSITGFQMRLRLYSLCGAARTPMHRQEVMRGVDAIVFVADAREDAAQSNIDSLLDLEKHLTDQGLNLSTFPLVIQVIHTSEEGARTAEAVSFDLNPYGFPLFHGPDDMESLASAHQQISETLGVRIHDNMTGNESAITLTAVHRAGQLDNEALIRSHIDTLRENGLVTESNLGREAPIYEEVLLDLPEGPVVPLGIAAEGFEGYHVTSVLDNSIERGVASIELILDQKTGGHPRRMTVLLENTEIPVQSTQDSAPSEGSLSSSPAPEPITKDLPNIIPFTAEPQQDSDFPGWIYGLLGIGGGVLVGILTGYLLFA